MSWDAGLLVGLGEFGDARLQKGGSCCTVRWFRRLAAGSAVLAGRERGRCGSGGCCIIRR